MLLLARYAALRARQIAKEVERVGSVIKVAHDKGMTVSAVRRFCRAAERSYE